jgi:hypothetical protein
VKDLSSCVLTVVVLPPAVVSTAVFTGPTPFASQFWISVLSATPSMCSVMVSSMRVV